MAPKIECLARVTTLAERTWLAGGATLVALGAVHSIAKHTRIQHDYRLVFVICA